MKAILTLTAVILLGTFAVAQKTTKEVKVETITTTIVLVKDIKPTNGDDIKVARLYKFKNSRVKKELAFKTKRNRSKLA